MRARKSIGFVVMCAVCAISMGDARASFSDTAGHSQELSINALNAQGIVSGYTDGTFGPDLKVNRAELLKMLVLGVGAVPGPEDTHCFLDVADEWFAPYVCYAKKQGWVSGYEDGTFQPGRPVLMVEALKMMMHAFGYVPVQSSSVVPLPGIDPAAWYAPYVALASEQNIVQFSDAFDPAEAMSRARISDMLYRGILKHQADLPQNTTKQKSSASSRAVVRPLVRGGLGDRGNSGGSGGGGETSGATSSSSSLSAPTISFNDISKDYGDASFTLSPTSDSAGLLPMTAAIPLWRLSAAVRSPS